MVDAHGRDHLSHAELALDADGKALQLMRSWFVAMPGETISCVGCHEQQNSTPRHKPTIAASKPPSDIEPWRGPVRGFAAPMLMAVGMTQTPQPEVLQRISASAPVSPAHATLRFAATRLGFTKAGSALR